MVTMNVRINDGNLALSEARVDRLLRGDTDGAKAMGLFDRMKDVVLNGGAKQAALNALVDRLKPPGRWVRWPRFPPSASTWSTRAT